MRIINLLINENVLRSELALEHNRESGSGWVRSSDGNGFEQLSTEDAVETTSRLRRKTYFKAKINSAQMISAHTTS